ncbi:MAG: hypothetical protein Q9164_007334, partial [Protoblastenia rupestris]
MACPGHEYRIKFLEQSMKRVENLYLADEKSHAKTLKKSTAVSMYPISKDRTQGSINLPLLKSIRNDMDNKAGRETKLNMDSYQINSTMLPTLSSYDTEKTPSPSISDDVIQQEVILMNSLGIIERTGDLVKNVWHQASQGEVGIITAVQSNTPTNKRANYIADRHSFEHRKN